MRCLCRPTRACFSFFCLFFVCLHYLSPVRRGWLFAHPGFPLSLNSSTSAPHGPNRAGNPFFWCRFPTLASKSQTGPHRGELGFSPQNEHTPPPKGGGARYRLSWVCWGCSAPPQLGHAGPTGLVWCCAGVVPCPTLKTAHRLSQGRVWFFSPKRVYPSP